MAPNQIQKNRKSKRICFLLFFLPFRNCFWHEFMYGHLLERISSRMVDVPVVKSHSCSFRAASTRRLARPAGVAGSANCQGTSQIARSHTRARTLLGRMGCSALGACNVCARRCCLSSDCHSNERMEISFCVPLSVACCATQNEQIVPRAHHKSNRHGVSLLTRPARSSMFRAAPGTVSMAQASQPGRATAADAVRPNFIASLSGTLPA